VCMKRTKYTKDILVPLVQESTSLMEVIRKLGLRSTGGSHHQFKKILLMHGIDTSHFLGQRSSLGRRFAIRRSADDILVLRTDGVKEKVRNLRRAMLERGVLHQCLWCGIVDSWNGKPLVLQVDHIDGNSSNNLLENLRFLCPNCHSQTETFGSKNKNALVVQLVDTQR
jgi:hypothetical protein